MRRFLSFFIVLAMTGCGVCKSVKPTIVYRDSVKVEYRDRIVRDTVRYEVPVEVEKIITRDTSSHLENTFAESYAVVSGGFLHHSLNTKAQSIPIPIEVEVHDTLFVEKEGVETIKEVKVEKSLSFGQKFKIGAFWWLLAACAFGYRKEILKLIKLVV